MIRDRLRTRYAPLFLLAFSLLGVAYLASGCAKNPSTPGTKLVPLSLVVQSSVSSGHATRALGAASFTAADSETIQINQTKVVLTRALLVARDVRFHASERDSAEDSTCARQDMMPTIGFAAEDSDTTAEHDGEGDRHDGEGDGHDNVVVFSGPFVIDLFSHTSSVLDTKLVPPGNYRRVTGHLQALGADDAAATPDLSFLVGSTVYLEGDVLGEGGGHFTYLARIDSEFQIRGLFTVLADTKATAFITFDVSRWLTGRDAQFLDPRIADNDESIKHAIRHSIKVGMDDDHDGHWGDHDCHWGDDETSTGGH